MGLYSYQELYDKIGYSFQNEDLLIRALTHKSSSASKNNERLEFLGDIILSYIISAELYDRPENLSEGDLSDCRAFLVKGDSLSELANELGISEFVVLGPAESRQDFSETCIYADCLEAIVAAIYLDSDIVNCRKVVVRWYSGRLRRIKPDSVKDSKTRLQEYTQSFSYSLPVYTLVEITGKEHAQVFHMNCTIAELNLVSQGRGRSKKKAEQDAAQKYLDSLNDDHE